MSSDNTEIYIKFENWLDNLLENNDMPADTKAFNFNLYDECNNVYGIQIIASDRFDVDDDEWACYELWSSEEDIFCISADDENDKSGQQAQKFITEMVADYLENGKYKNILLDSNGIGIGFVDGDIDIIFKSEN